MVSGLPPLYDRWVDEMLPHPAPEEAVATCDDCAMCGAGGGFDPRIKCCTYIPDLPNFLVGGAILDGCCSILRRLDAGVGVTPLGLGRSPAEERIWSKVGQDFGMTPEVTCPYYDPDDGLCSIWPHRNAACYTYFCRYERGPAWRGFWWAVNRTLAEAERTLSGWCGDRPFVECARLVRDLSWGDVLGIGGSDLAGFARQAGEAQASLLAETVPDSLRPGAYRVLRSEADRVWIVTDERFGPIRVPRRVLEALPSIAMDHPLLHHLIGYGILVPS
jgi:hypothetical protein